MRSTWLRAVRFKICLMILLGMGMAISCGGEGWCSSSGDSTSQTVILNKLFAHGSFPRRDMAVTTGARTITLPQRSKRMIITEPGTLSQSDTEYVLDHDVTVDGTAFTIEASGVTLNLNGHTLTYLNKPALTSVFGVYIPGYHRKDITIANGRIVQGDGAANTKVSCPVIYDYDASGIEIGGLEIVYQTPDTSGILLHWANDARIHDNTITDQGSIVTNRHQGVAVIEANRGGRGARYTITGNLIKGARHNGIRAGKESEISGNDIIIDSRVTNSCGISAAGVISHNRIIGGGVHPIGIWPGSSVKVADNYVEVQNTRRGDEYGDTGAACLRMTWGNDNVEVMNNSFILHAGASNKNGGVKSWGRALWVGLPKPEQKALFHDNLIVATNNDGTSKAAAIAVVCLNESPHLVFRHNTVVSNWSTVLLADSYGHAAGYARFVDNRFIGLNDHGGFKTIRSQYSDNASTGVFINNIFEGAASADDVDLEFAGKGLKELAFGWRLNAAITEAGKPLVAANVKITDASGVTVFEGVSGQQGNVAADLITYLLTNQSRTRSAKNAVAKKDEKGSRVDKTPHTLRVAYGEQVIEKNVLLQGNTNIEIAF